MSSSHLLTSPGSPPIQQTLTTDVGVKVVVQHHRAPKPISYERKVPEPTPRVVIVPAGLSKRERDALFTELVQEHGDDLDAILRGRKDVHPESRKDVRQRVLLVLLRHIEEAGEGPRHVPAFLACVVRNEVSNHKQRWVPRIVPGADVNERASSSRSPEAKVAFAERCARLERYLHALPVEEAEAVRCIDLLEMTIKDAAQVLGRPRSTVADQYARGIEKLEALACASERGAGPGA